MMFYIMWCSSDYLVDIVLVADVPYIRWPYCILDMHTAVGSWAKWVDDRLMITLLYVRKLFLRDDDVTLIQRSRHGPVKSEEGNTSMMMMTWYDLWDVLVFWGMCYSIVYTVACSEVSIWYSDDDDGIVILNAAIDLMSIIGVNGSWYHYDLEGSDDMYVLLYAIILLERLTMMMIHCWNLLLLKVAMMRHWFYYNVTWYEAIQYSYSVLMMINVSHRIGRAEKWLIWWRIHCSMKYDCYWNDALMKWNWYW